MTTASGSERAYAVCANCIMDTSDSNVTFDARGWCDYCHNYYRNIVPNWHPDERGAREIAGIAERIRAEGKGRTHMACERPVLAYAEADSDLGDLVRRARCGTVVPPGAPEQLAAAVREAMRSPSACAEMGRAGRAHVLAHYSRDSVSAQYETLVREVAGLPPQPAGIHG